jgi:hypothetical protein
MVMITATQMIVADYGNKKIKMIDVNRGTLVSDVTLSSGPEDVIKLPGNKLAAALRFENCIQIMSYTDRSLTQERRIDVGYRCYCIAHCQDKLVVGCNFNPGKLVILDLDGNIIQVFDTPGLFDSPAKIVISREEKFMYVSDYYSTSKFMKLDWQGNVIQIFEDPGYERPTGIQELEDGTLLICYRDTSNIVRLSSSFNKCEIVELNKINLRYPKAVTYNEIDHKLYISSSSDQRYNTNDTIKVFNIRFV